MPAAPHHSVYVVELDPRVLEVKKFRAANPDYEEGFPCVYVGMTGLAPKERFRNHKKAKKANRFARDFGMKLLPRLYERYNPMTYAEAQETEARLARRLRYKGYAVWQH